MGKSGLMHYYTYLLVTGLLVVVHGIDTEVGQSVTLPCTLQGEYTFPEWLGPPDESNPLTNNDAFLNTGMTFAANQRDLVILSAETIHTGTYVCKDETRTANVQLAVKQFQVSIEYNDTIPSLVGSTFIDPGNLLTNVTVTCTVQGGYPSPAVDITLEDGTAITTVTPGITKTELTTNNTYIVTKSIQFEATEAFDRQYVTCMARFYDDDRNASRKARLHFTVIPTLSAISLSMGQMKVGGSMYYEMTTYLSRPRVAMTWNISSLDPNISNRTRVNQTHCIQDQRERYNCTSYLHLFDMVKEDSNNNVSVALSLNGEVYKTQLMNRVFVPFGPSTVEISGSNVYPIEKCTPPNEACPYPTSWKFTCAADSSRASNIDNSPSGVNMEWFNGTDKIEPISLVETESPGENYGLIRKEIAEIKINRHMDGATIRCIIQEEYYSPYWTILEAVTILNVTYWPLILEPWQAEFRVYEGDAIRIPCSVESKPESRITITKLHDNGTSTDMTVEGTEYNRRSLNIVTATESDESIYECMATNGLNPDAKHIFRLTVHEKPATTNTLTTVARGEDSVRLTFDSIYINNTRYKCHVQYMSVSDNTNYWYTLDEDVKSTNIQLTSLSPDSRYRVRVKIEDTLIGLHHFSSETSFTTKTYTWTTVERGEDYVRLMFDSIYINNTRYKCHVQYMAVSDNSNYWITLEDDVKSSNIQLNNLSPDTEYRVRVKIEDTRFGLQHFSSETSFTTKTADKSTLQRDTILVSVFATLFVCLIAAIVGFICFRKQTTSSKDMMVVAR